MNTTANNINYNPATTATVTKTASPGAVVTQTTITQPVTSKYAPVNKKFEIFSSIFGVLAGIFMFVGAVLNIIAMGLILRNGSYYYYTTGILLVIGFSFWFASALLNWIPSFGGFARSTRSGYLLFNFFGSILGLLAFALFVIGAAFWLSVYGGLRYAGQIIWIIAGSFWVASVLLRDLGVRWDGMNTYKNHPVDGTNTTNKSALAAHLSSFWSNALATDLYLITSVLFLLGAIFFDSLGRNGGSTNYTGREFEVAAAILWLVGSSIIILSSISHCISRR